MTDTHFDDDEADLAAEYALGILSAEDRREAERRRARDPSFDRDVSAWEERLASLNEATAPVDPPDVVWRRITAQIGPAARKTGAWHDVRVWRLATGAFAAAAATAGVVLLQQPGAPPVRPLLPATGVGTMEPLSVGLLRADDEAQVSFVVTLDRRSRQLLIAPVTDAAAPGRAYEVWMLPDGTAPVSLGVLGAGEVVVIDAARLLSQPTPPGLAISVEPTGGSPTGTPTGPVIATGSLTTV